MADNQCKFHDLMDQVLAGSETAARDLVRLYGPAVLRAVRRRLHSRLRSKFDSDDFVQDVWASFFAAPPEQNAFERPEDLAAWLARLARNKVVDAVRLRLQREKFNLNREESLQDTAAPVEQLLVAGDPSPSTTAMSREEWEALLGRQPLVYRHVLVQFREGRSPAEIAAAQKVSERTVRRIITRVLPGWIP
jgi:RNA polymerase sigma-70 factor (ECF subfamily)